MKVKVLRKRVRDLKGQTALFRYHVPWFYLKIYFTKLSHLINNLQIAADDFFKPVLVDFLLAVNVFCSILLPNKIIDNDNIPTFLHTILIHIIMGEAPIDSQFNFISPAFCTFSVERPARS